ncbi:phospholipid/cholesterol/gamma-HCH transport system permease protein [Mariprofundus ferrinatatus]|uniref:Phospholipid/cholesterol/gamma-HCH transport system permease protein n=1 Tax=Mariprofundus ferrinatatus TaxID=1921087 RepID=A0A2K8L672_9PROT|nr:ABC transporter permease [Mariprofundus ferrinatatus]ATX82818.1 phospholipid/cholesterol/gamma-HCH transport system permease protein [Mariprofundus ferrinatatus]
MDAKGQITGRINRHADQLGGAVIRIFADFRRAYRLTTDILAVGLRMQWVSKPAVSNVVFRQIYFTGVQGVPWVVLVALGVGALSVYNIVDLAKSIQDMSMIGQLISTLLVQEIAPLIVTILLLSRSGVAVVTELGTMHVRGEDLTLGSMGINKTEYLLWPRLMAFTLCGLILTFIFVFVSIWLGGLMVSLGYEINFIDFLIEVRRGTTMEEIVMLLGKATLYPMLSAVMLLNMGCKVGREPNLIPVYATQGVLGSLMLVVMSDALIALIVELA